MENAPAKLLFAKYRNLHAGKWVKFASVSLLDDMSGRLTWGRRGSCPES